jgi:hypothetical protein
MKSLSSIAAEDLDLSESPKGSNKGPQIQKFFDADDLDEKDGYPWCASAVSYWTQKYLAQIPDSKIKAPKLASVYLMKEWAQKQGLLIRNGNPKPNDIVIFQFSHIGIVETVNSNGFTAIEGNTNDEGSREGFEVARRTRKMTDAKHFITVSKATL